MLLAAGLLAGACSLLDPGTGEIRFQVEDAWQSGTKASLYGAGSVATGSFGVAAYTHGTTTAYIAGSTVSYAAGAWSFDDGRRYWPASGTLDFHAWMPVSRPAYITSPTYTAGNPGFTCTNLPLTSAGQAAIHEYIYAVKTNHGKDHGEVTLAFQRPLAQIRFQMSGSPGVTLHSITVKNVYNNGVYTHASGWTNTGSAGDLVFNLGSTHYDEGVSVIALATPLLVKPQAIGTQQIEVDYTLDGGPRTQKTFSVSIVSWAAGYGYTYTLNMPDWLSVDASGEAVTWISELLGAGPVVNWISEFQGTGAVINWRSSMTSEGDDVFWSLTGAASGEEFAWGPPVGFGGPFTYEGKKYFISQGNMYKTATGYALYSDWTGGLNQYNVTAPGTQTWTGNSYFNWIHLAGLFDTSINTSANESIDNDKTPIAGCYLPTQVQWAAFTTGTSRPGSSVNGTAGCRYALIQLTSYTNGSISNPVGLLLIPDGLTLTGMTKTFTWNTNSTSGNTGVTVAQLNGYLTKGCVFLPASGRYDGTWRYGGTYGYCWSARSYNSSHAYYLYFLSSSVFPADGINKSDNYCPVRLICE